MSCIRSSCHLWFPIAFRMAGFIRLTDVTMVSLSIGNSLLLVAVMRSSPLRLSFSLYTSRWSLTCKETFLAVRAWFTIITISAASLHHFASIYVVRWRGSFLSTLVWFITGPGNSAAAILSCAFLRPVIVVFICLLTVCHVHTNFFDAHPTAPIVMLWKGRVVGVVLTGVREKGSARLERVMRESGGDGQMY